MGNQVRGADENVCQRIRGDLGDISGYYANPFCVLFLVVSDYKVVGAHLRPRI